MPRALRFAVMVLAMAWSGGGRYASAQTSSSSAPDAGAPAASSTKDEGEAKDEAPPEKKTPMAGYAYSDKAGRAPAGASRPRAKAHPTKAGPTATLPGFEMREGGGSRLFVQLSEKVPVEERAAPGTLTYVLKGAHVAVRNNTNALVTVHFNTPVTRARLVPKGSDLLFVVDLRAASKPTWKVDEAPDKTNMLIIDFPKGDFDGEASEADAQPAPAPAKKESPKAHGRSRGHGTTSAAPH